MRFGLDSAGFWSPAAGCWWRSLAGHCPRGGPAAHDLRLATRFLLAWDLTAFIYVAFAFLMIARSDVETCHARAALYDESDWVIVALVVGSAAASFAAIFAELAAIKSGEAPPRSAWS